MLNGAAAGVGAGLSVAATGNGSIIRGFTINRFSGNGIVLRSDGNIIETCFIGTNPFGTAAAGNGLNGIAIVGNSTGNVIGGAGLAKNLISGNLGHGVVMQGVGVTGNVVRGSFIGTNLAGDTALPNAFSGITIYRGANNNTVGDANQVTQIVTLVAGNNGHGINIQGAATSGNDVVFTSIGSNFGSGVKISRGATNNTIGGLVDGEFNVISSNFRNGVQITNAGTTGNVVVGNMIGTDQDGLLALGNGRNGVAITAGADGNTIGGIAPFAGNVISSNTRNGVNVAGAGTSGNLVAGNHIGTNAPGTAALANGFSGVQIATGANGNTIGGTTAEALNLISGNTLHGIILTGTGVTGNTVQGNSIGTNLAGTTAIANGRHGVNIAAGARANTIGGSAAGQGNTISGNARVGVLVAANQTIIRGNNIGTNEAGTAPLANGSHGVFVTANGSNTLIGGVITGEGNLIANNGGVGVLIGSDPAAGFPTPAGTGNSILGNSIFSNALFGIDLGPNNGMTPNDPNDADTGPNGRQNFPAITSATILAGVTITINVTLASRPNTIYRIECFASVTADPSGFGQGQTFLGSIDVTTDATGAAIGTGIFAYSPTFGTRITATATDLTTNDSSEFSQAVTATP